MIYKSTLQVSTHIDALSQILTWFNQLNEQNIVPRKTWIKCQTLLAEGFTNVVRHAHQDHSSDTPIEIEVIICDRHLSIRIWDRGPGFNLNQKLEEILSRSDPYRTSGRGLIIMKRMADHVSYTCSPGSHNCLLIAKNLNSDNSESENK